MEIALPYLDLRGLQPLSRLYGEHPRASVGYLESMLQTSYPKSFMSSWRRTLEGVGTDEGIRTHPA